MKKISVDTVKAFLKEHKHKDPYTKTFEVAGSSFEVIFRTNLSIAEKTVFINRVLSGCFDSAGDFRPEYVLPVLRATILQMCTNVPAFSLKNSSDAGGQPILDLEAMNELYMAMDLNNLDDPEFQNMLDEMTLICSKAIDWKKSRILSEYNTDSALSNLLDTLTEKINSIDAESISQYVKAIFETAKDSEGETGKKLIELNRYRDGAGE